MPQKLDSMKRNDASVVIAVLVLLAGAYVYLVYPHTTYTPEKATSAPITVDTTPITTGVSSSSETKSTSSSGVASTTSSSTVIVP